MKPIADLNSDHVVDGNAVDIETIIKQRDHIEDVVRGMIGDFAYSKLATRMAKNGTMDFEIHFFKEPKVDEQT